MTMPPAYRIRTEKTYFETKEDLGVEFRRWGVREWHLERKGAEAKVSWFPRGSDSLRELTSADQARIEDNARKLLLIIEALRLNELRGFDVQMREFYLQLPAGAAHRDPYEVLGVRPDADLEDIEGMYRIKAKRLHPDAGGTAEAMKELNEAWERIRKERANGG